MSKIIPKRTLDDIRFRNDIADVIGSYITIKKAGSSFKGLCPFHKEKTPSFHVNLQKQIFHCFGCGAGGDVFGFVMQYEGVDFMTAVRMMAEKAGVQLDYEEGEAGSSNREKLFRIHAEVAALYRGALMERNTAAVARDYLDKRGIAAEISEEFLIGYAPARWDAVLNWARKNKYSDELMEESGLVVKKDMESGEVRHYDRFRDRLMFPVSDEQGRIIGFSGRSLEKDSKMAKYVNSPETPLFHKGRVLYALDKARRSIVESREVIICEGQIDVIRCHQAGFKTAVAAQGTAFTEDHVKVIRRYADSVVIVFDPDKAGQDAAVKAAVTFLAAGLAVRVAILPPGEDPDSFIVKEGAESFGKIIEKAGSVINYQVNVLSDRENIKSEVGMMRVAKAVLATIARSPNSVQKAKLVQEAAGLLGVPATALQDDLKHLERNMNYRAQVSGKNREKMAAPAEMAPLEIALCHHLANAVDNPELVPMIEKYLPLDMITSDHCRRFIESVLKAQSEGLDLQAVINDNRDESGELQKFAASVIMAPSKTCKGELTDVHAVRDIILKLWRNRLKRERDTLVDKDDGRRIQITYDLKGLTNWEQGADIIEMEIG